MIFYLVLFCLCVGILLWNRNKENIVISILFIWIVFAFRDSVGVDDRNYISAFEAVNKGWSYDIEWSYRVISLIAYKIGLTYKAIFLLYATISFYYFYKSINIFFVSNQKKAMFIACFFGIVFVSAMSVMRQFLASCICFYSIALIYKKNKLLGPILYCVAATFVHGAAIISIPLLFVFRSNFIISYRKKLVIILISLTLGYSGVINIIMHLLIHFLPKSYQIYENEISGSFSSAGGTLSIVLLFLFSVQTCFSIRGGNKISENRRQMFLEKGQLVYLVILFIFVHSGVASRLAFTYIIFSATIPITFTKRIEKKNRVIAMLGVYAVAFALYIMALRSVSMIESSGFIPYNASFNFWS